VGILDGTCVSDLFPWVMEMLGEAYPTVDLKLHYHSFNGLAAGLYDGSLDLVLTLLFDIRNRDNLKFRVIEKSKDHIVVHRNHPLAEKDFVHLSDLKNETFIIVAMSDSERSANLILEGCRSQGFFPKSSFAVDPDQYALGSGGCGRHDVRLQKHAAQISGYQVPRCRPGQRSQPDRRLAPEQHQPDHPDFCRHADCVGRKTLP
jgi:DNA-binding transcriptional LysR family regulator